MGGLMFKKKLLHKILAIIAITLFIGINIVGLLAIWLQYRATLDLQVKNSRTMSSVIINEIGEFMMKDDSKGVQNLAKVSKEQKFGFDLKVYNPQGKESSASGAAANPEVLQALATGKRQETRLLENGVHTLRAVVPLEGYQRTGKRDIFQPGRVPAISIGQKPGY